MKLLFLALSVGIFGTLMMLSAEQPTTVANEPSDEPVPVDDDMHHLMEYVFEPAYKRLKKNMAEEPADKNGWSALKEDSLTLAESTNLLLHRKPDENKKQWVKLSVETRAIGGELYQAARKRDFATSQKHYRALLQKCNACHDAFADGEHQLAP